MEITLNDRSIMRALAEEWVSIAELPINAVNIAEWKRLNALKPGKPLICIRDLPMHELKDDPELQIKTVDPRLQGHEFNMRWMIWNWRHLRGDMVVEKKYPVGYVVHNTGFGIDVAANEIGTIEGAIASHQYVPSIHDESDIEKIHAPQISVDWEATEANYQFINDIFGGILPVEKRGLMGFWCSPWDQLVMWWGVQEVLMDLVMRPEMVHAAMSRLVDAYLSMIDQYENLGLFALNNCNNEQGGLGPAGHGWTDELPQPGFDPAHVRAMDLWGNCTAQIFSEVSPAMHEEFALQHERRLLERFGLNGYGCCEPLHRKIDILKKNIPRLRRISMSPWVNIDEAVENMGNQFVFSHKPSPFVFPVEVFNPTEVEATLRDTFTKARANGCIMEVIMNGISTTREDPKRMWQWAEIASRVAEEFA